MRRIGLLLLALVCLPAAALAAFYGPPVPSSTWPTYTPTIAASSDGSNTIAVTSASGTASYQVTGKRVDWTADITISTNGTASGGNFLKVSLPLQNGSVTFDAVGHELLNTGKQVVGFINSNSNQVLIRFYDGTYPGSNGARIVVSGFYMLP